jgi:hypothetical protein
VSIWKVILATLVIFGAGIVTGGLFVNRMHQATPAAAASQNESTKHPLSVWERPVINTNNPPHTLKV